MSVPGRPPPHSPEAEQNLLSCCLLDGADTIAKCLEKPLPSAAFYSPANRIIYEKLCEIYQKRKTVELAVLAEELKTEQQLEAIGGYAYLTHISSSMPTTAQAGYFVEKVRELYVLREFIKTSVGAVELAFNYQGGLDEFLDGARTRFDAVVETGLSFNELSAHAYDHSKAIPKPDAIFSLAGTCISTAGNITTIYSKPKVGKTAFVGAMIAAAITNPTAGFDTLGIVGPNYAGGALLHFDTEQSPYDHQQMIHTALRRVGHLKPPEWFSSYHLTGLPAQECRRMVESAIRQAKRKFKSVFAVIIDGVADLVVDPNESEECFPLVTRLHSLAIQYQTAFINILHLNPTGDEKGRGHLGSQLERKSESNLMMEIDSAGITSVWGEKQRGKAIRKIDAVCFRWSDQHRMHVTQAVTRDEEVRGRPNKYDFNQFLVIWPRGKEKAQKRSTLYQMAHEVNTEISSTSFSRMVEEAVARGELNRVSIEGGNGFKYYMEEKKQEVREQQMPL